MEGGRVRLVVPPSVSGVGDALQEEQLGSRGGGAPWRRRAAHVLCFKYRSNANSGFEKVCFEFIHLFNRECGCVFFTH